MWFMHQERLNAIDYSVRCAIYANGNVLNIHSGKNKWLMLVKGYIVRDTSEKIGAFLSLVNSSQSYNIFSKFTPIVTEN